MDSAELTNIPLSDEDVNEYQSLVFAYREYSDEINNLERQKKKQIDFDGFWGLLCIVAFYGFIFLLVYLGSYLDLGDYGFFIGILVFFGGLYLMGIFIDSKLSSKLASFFENLFTLGRLNEAKKINNDINIRIDKILVNKENTRKRIQYFEQRIKIYYEEYLESFFLNNLYKKRSNNDNYKACLDALSLMVEEAEMVKKSMVVEKINLSKYEGYIFEKQIKILFDDQVDEHKDRQRSYVTPLGEKMGKAIKNLSEPKILPPPEILYRKPRKIDWDKANKAQRATGLKGEEMVLEIEKEYLRSINRSDLADKIRHVSVEDGDGLGYDILSFFADGREKYIEVKSSNKAISSSFYISRNELGFLENNKDVSYIYRIGDVGEDNINSTLEVLSTNEILSSQIVPTQFIVKINNN